MIEAAAQRRRALRGERTFLMALFERYERNQLRLETTEPEHVKPKRGE
jgi:hypothetical protein